MKAATAAVGCMFSGNSQSSDRQRAPLGSDCSGLISAKLIDLPCAAVLSLITVSHDTGVVCVLLFAWLTAGSTL